MLNTSTTVPFEIEVAMDEAAELLEALLLEGDRVFLHGKPGIGKTEIVHQAGAKLGWGVKEFHASLREPVDVRGVPATDPVTKTTVWYVPDELPRADRDGENGILFLDEFNQASPQMQSALGGLVLYGVIGDYHLPKGWRVVAAGNRVSDRAAAQRIPTHIRNRFAHLFCVESVDSWVKWANANGQPQELVAFIRFRKGEVLHRMPRGDENAFPTPRSLVKAGKYVKVAKSSTRQKLFAAHIGNDVAGELNGFIELYQSIGTLEDIIKSPDTAKVPTEASLLYATCTGLARMATRKNWRNVIKYATRVPSEHQMLLIHDATMRDPSLKETKEYGEWHVNNQNYVLQN